MYNTDAFVFSEQIYINEFVSVLKLLNESYDQIIKNEDIKKNDMETFIRNVLVKNYLRNRANKEKFNIGYLGFEVESGEINKNNKTAGFIDIKVINLGKKDFLDEEEYYAIECKRLDGYSKKNRLYIKEGIYRFISGKYSSKMPLAGMIGFIQRGIIVDIVDNINKKISEEEDDSYIGHLKKDKILSQCNFIYSSENTRMIINRKIKIYHYMMDFSEKVMVLNRLIN